MIFLSTILLAVMTELTSIEDYVYSSPRLRVFSGDVNRESMVARQEDIAWLTEAGYERLYVVENTEGKERLNPLPSEDSDKFFDTKILKGENVGSFMASEWGDYYFGMKGIFQECASRNIYDTNLNLNYYIRNDVEISPKSILVDEEDEYLQGTTLLDIIDKEILNLSSDQTRFVTGLSTNYPVRYGYLQTRPVKKEFITSAFEDSKKLTRILIMSTTDELYGSDKGRKLISKRNEYHYESGSTTNFYDKPYDYSDGNFSSPGKSTLLSIYKTYNYSEYASYYWESGNANVGEGKPYSIINKDSDVTYFSFNKPCVSFFTKNSYYQRASFDSPPRVTCNIMCGIFKYTFNEYSSASAQHGEWIEAPDGSENEWWEIVFDVNESTNVYKNGWVIIPFKNVKGIGSLRGKLSGDKNKYYQCGWEFDLGEDDIMNAIESLDGEVSIKTSGSYCEPRYQMPSLGGEVDEDTRAGTQSSYELIASLVGIIAIFDLNNLTTLPDEEDK
jgi:hypothetical protein